MIFVANDKKLCTCLKSFTKLIFPVVKFIKFLSDKILSQKSSPCFPCAGKFKLYINRNVVLHHSMIERGRVAGTSVSGVLHNYSRAFPTTLYVKSSQLGSKCYVLKLAMVWGGIEKWVVILDLQFNSLCSLACLSFSRKKR